MSASPIFDPFDDGTPSPALAKDRPTATPGSDEYRSQLAEYAASGCANLDEYAASKAKGAGKGRRRQPDFKPHAKAYYLEKGQVFEPREQSLWIPGADRPMKVDYKGLFDGVICEDGQEIIGVQLCNKEGVLPHVRKMLSLKRGYAGIRRNNMLKWWGEGKKTVVLYFWQDGGKGTRWKCAEREVTKEDLRRIMEGKQLRFDGDYRGRSA